MNKKEKFIDKLVRYKYFNLIFWCIYIPISMVFCVWFANGLYNIIKELMK